MKEEIRLWLDNLDKQREESGVSKLLPAEREKLIKGLEAPNGTSIYGLPPVYSIILRTYVLSKEKENLAKLGKEVRKNLDEEKRKRYTNDAISRYTKKVQGKLNSRINTERVDVIETEISDIRKVSLGDLEVMFGTSIARELQERAHKQGLCLKGEIPEDLIYFGDLGEIPKFTLKKQSSLIHAGYAHVSDITTRFSNADRAQEAILRARPIGVGQITIHRILDLIAENGFAYESREQKLSAYQKQITNAHK